MPLATLLRSCQDAPAPDFITRPAIAAERDVSHYRLRAI